MKKKSKKTIFNKGKWITKSAYYQRKKKKEKLFLKWLEGWAG